jgi:hypothetical protein
MTKEVTRLLIRTMMTFDGREAWYWVARRRPLRRLAGLLLRSFSRRVLSRFDLEDPTRAQTRLLLGLLHQARQTPFGREHDFARMRTPEDFRRLVPLSRPSAPVHGGTDAAHRAAWRVALALALQAGARLPLAPGSFAVLNEPVDGPGRLPYLIAPFASVLPGPDVVCLAGSVAQLLNCASADKPEARSLASGMPNLALVLYQAEAGDSVEALRAAVTENTVLLETAVLFDTPIAVQDPRCGGLRLLADHGTWFEFVPLDQVHGDRPERLSLDQVKAGIPYELVITRSPGLWACRTGQVLCFERLEPLLVTFTGPVPPPPVVNEVSVPTPPVPPVIRPRSDGIPAVPTGMFGHTLWSARVDRG